MYIYDRKFSGPASLLNITIPSSQRYSLQLNGFSGSKSGTKSVAKLRVGSYWANDFSKGCKNDERLKYSDDLAKGFAKAMAAQGHQWAVNHGSSHASPLDWFSYTDKSGTSYDNSEKIQGADTTDFAYLSTHSALTFVDKPAPTDDLFIFRAGFGQNAPSVAADAFKVESGSGAWPNCIWLNNKSKLGDKRLRWLVVDACESLQLPGFAKHLKMNLDVTPAKMWGHAFHGLNMVFGFTGDASDSWWMSDRGANFGRRAGAGHKLAGAWTDEAYSHWTNENPVALACGRNEADAEFRLGFDRVTAPFNKIPHDEIGAYAWISRS